MATIISAQHHICAYGSQQLTHPDLFIRERTITEPELARMVKFHWH